MPSCILALLSTGESLPLREFLIARILAKVLHTGKSIGEIRSLAQQNKFLGNLHISLNHSRYIDVRKTQKGFKTLRLSGGNYYHVGLVE